jgi:hypothetical protein
MLTLFANAAKPAPTLLAKSWIGSVIEQGKWCFFGLKRTHSSGIAKLRPETKYREPDHGQELQIAFKNGMVPCFNKYLRNVN